MRISYVAFMVTVICSLAALGAAQAYPPRAAASSVPPAMPAAPVAPVTASALLHPALDAVQQTLFAIRLEKWKRGTVRDEANSNVGTILHDIEDGLPPLLRQADASPGVLSKELPVARNVDALYDVLLRVVEASRVAAPRDQVVELQQALLTLSKARLALDQRMQNLAVSLERQVSTMRSVLQSQAVAQCPVTPPPLATVCVMPFRHLRVMRRRRVYVRTAKKKPSTSTSANKGTAQSKGK